MSVSKSTRVCSAHFSRGSLIPYVKSPSLKKPEQPTQLRVLVRKSVKDRYQFFKPVPSLSELCKEYATATIKKCTELEHMTDALGDSLAKKEGKCSELSTRLNQSLQQIVVLEKRNGRLQFQQIASTNKIESLQTELQKLSLEKECLQKSVQTYEEKCYRLRAEHFENRDKDIQFYTGFMTWNLFMLFFQSLQVYDLQNLQYVGREQTFPEGKKRGPPRALNSLNELFLTLEAGST